MNILKKWTNAIESTDILFEIGQMSRWEDFEF